MGSFQNTHGILGMKDTITAYSHSASNPLNCSLTLKMELYSTEWK